MDYGGPWDSPQGGFGAPCVDQRPEGLQGERLPGRRVLESVQPRPLALCQARHAWRRVRPILPHGTRSARPGEPGRRRERGRLEDTARLRNPGRRSGNIHARLPYRRVASRLRTRHRACQSHRRRSRPGPRLRRQLEPDFRFLLQQRFLVPQGIRMAPRLQTPRA